MELVGIWRKHFSLRYVPITMIQVVSAAATIFVVAAVQAVSGPRIAHGALESAEKSAESAIQYLREVGVSFASATNVADILQHLIHEQVQTRKARRSPGSSPSGASHIGSMVSSWQSPDSTPIRHASGSGGNLNANSTPPWAELSGMYAHAPHSMGHSNDQYSSLAGALESPLSFQQPFGDGLGDSLYLPAGVTLPGMNVGGIVRGDATATDDPLAAFRPQQAFYAYHWQMNAPPVHSARQ
jgi:hypothetical protein